MAEGEKIEDLGTAVDALLRSESWERRLAAARESRRKVLAARKSGADAPLVPAEQPVLPETLPEPEPAPAPRAAPEVQQMFRKPPEPPRAARRWVVPLLAAILVLLAVAFFLVPDRTAEPVQRNSQGERTLGYAMSDPLGSVALPDRFPVAVPVPQAITVPLNGRPALSMAPPATEREAYALFLARLRASVPDARIKVHLPPEAPAMDGTVASDYAMPANVLRFYHPEDAAPARRAAEFARARLADMTGYRPRPDRGELELWVTTLPPPA